MNTRHSDTQLEHRKAYLQSLQTTSKEFKAARDKIPRGVGRSKQWYSSGQFWGKNYIVGLIVRAEKFRLLDEDELFKLRKHSPQYTAWAALGPKKRKAADSPGAKPPKKACEPAPENPVAGVQPASSHSSSSTASDFASPEEEALVFSVLREESEPLPNVTDGSVHWQNETAQSYESAVTHQDKPMADALPVARQKKSIEEYVKEYTVAVQAQGYQKDDRPISQQRSDKSVSYGVKHQLLYQQIHGLHEELTPPTMGCLFPVWYKGNNQMTISELKAIFDTKKAAFAAKMDTNTSYKMSALNRWTEYCRAHHGADLLCTLDKFLAFCVWVRGMVMADAIKYSTPDRVFSNVTREVMYKLLWHHGYVEKNEKNENYDPRPLPQYADLKVEVKAAQKSRLRRKVKFADDYKINEAAAAKLNHAPFDISDPVKSLQLGMLLTLMYGFVLRPHQSTLVTRFNVGISKMEGSMSFGTSDTINIVTRCTNKSGNENPEQLFAVKTFDSRCFSMHFWMALNDVYINDVRLPKQSYVCKTGRFKGRQVSSLVQMTAEGLTDAVMERHPIDLTIERLGPQVLIFERMPLVPHAQDLFRFTESAVLNQALVLKCLEKLGMKGDGTTADDVLSYMFKTARICQLK